MSSATLPLMPTGRDTRAEADLSFATSMAMFATDGAPENCRPCVKQIAKEAADAAMHCAPIAWERRKVIVGRMVSLAKERCGVDIQWLYDTLEARGWFDEEGSKKRAEMVEAAEAAKRKTH